MLILAYDYPPNDGGISRLGAGIAEELVSRGQTPEVITLRRGEREGPVRPHCTHREVTPGRGRRDLETLRYLLTAPRTSPVLATVWNPEATLAVLARHRRLTILAHGNEVMDYRGKPARARLRRHVLEKARTIVCNSAYTAQLVRRAAPKSRTCVINPAVDSDRFVFPAGKSAARAALNLPQNRLVLLTVSRLDAIKGHDTVLRAIAALSAGERRQLYYVIAGKGEHSVSLQSMVAELGLQGTVRFTGFVSETDLPALYAAADLFVLCSIEEPQRNAVEGFGMVFSEAQSAGLAVLGTRSGGIPDAVCHGEGGWLVDERDHAAVAGYLKLLCADPSPFVREGARGRRRVLRDMSWASYVDRLLEVV